MTSIVELFPKSRKLAYDSRQLLCQLQNGQIGASELFLSVEELGRQLSIMEGMLPRETPAQRQVWGMKLKELRVEVANLQRQGDYYNRMMMQRSNYERQREDLLALRRRSRKSGVDAHGTRIGEAMNDLAEESDSWASSHNMVSELIGSGQASLSSLVEQRQRLKGIKRVLFQITNKLGLSNSLMRIVERRDATDAYLVFGGMILTLIVLYLCWFW
jgi:Golgi SNAP receptor complex protein 2